jgi:hypothetical protein
VEQQFTIEDPNTQKMVEFKKTIHILCNLVNDQNQSYYSLICPILPSSDYVKFCSIEGIVLKSIGKKLYQESDQYKRVLLFMNELSGINGLNKLLKYLESIHPSASRAFGQHIYGGKLNIISSRFITQL